MTEFTSISIDFWNNYLKRIDLAQRNGLLESNTPNAVLLFPNLIICADTPHFFVMELAGCRRAFSPLIEKTHKGSTIDEYLGQFTLKQHVPMMTINAHGTGLIRLVLTRAGAELELSRRFPNILDLLASRLAFDPPGGSEGAILLVKQGANYFCIEECVLVNKYKSAVRIRHISLLLVIAKPTTTSDYKAYLKRDFLDTAAVRAVRTVPAGSAETLVLAGQFANLFLLHNLRETTLGEFLNSHPEIIKDALSTPDFIYEPYLEWQEGQADASEKAINPDLMIKRSDGFFDIYDLKRPLLERSTLTKGKRQRRRFIDYVEEGVAQLAHYQEYFTHESNRQHAYERYGIRIDQPRSVLVVGNYENVDQEQIDEACRRLKSFELIDYDTILQLYLEAHDIRQQSGTSGRVKD
jgi:hypothetical protein